MGLFDKITALFEKSSDSDGQAIREPRIPELHVTDAENEALDKALEDNVLSGDNVEGLLDRWEGNLLEGVDAPTDGVSAYDVEIDDPTLNAPLEKSADSDGQAMREARIPELNLTEPEIQALDKALEDNVLSGDNFEGLLDRWEENLLGDDRVPTDGVSAFDNEFDDPTLSVSEPSDYFASAQIPNGADADPLADSQYLTDLSADAEVSEPSDHLASAADVDPFPGSFGGGGEPGGSPPMDGGMA